MRMYVCILQPFGLSKEINVRLRKPISMFFLFIYFVCVFQTWPVNFNLFIKSCVQHFIQI